MNASTSRRLTLLCVAIAAIAPISASAQNRPPQGPPITEMASHLNVSEAALKNCMPRPAKGERPDRPDPATITSCLSDDNPAITQKEVAKVLKDNAPQRPQRSN